MIEYVSTLRKYIGHETLLLVGAGVFVHKAGKLLLQKRRDNGCWSNHGGCVELGERVEDAAKRELLEETGLTARHLTLLGVFSGENMFYTYPNGDKTYIIDISYLCEDFSGECVCQASEVTELRWFAQNELPDAISPPVQPALSACLKVLHERK